MRPARAQIKMGETLAILIIFFFLVVFGFSFYVRVQGTSFDRQREESADLRAIQIAQKTSFLTELQCTSRNIPEDNCYDLLKLGAFSYRLNHSAEFYDHYYNLFGVSEIFVDSLYPEKKSYVLYVNKPDSFEHFLVTRIPISLYNATANRHVFGLLTVMTYG
jgi:hypothetical protein